MKIYRSTLIRVNVKIVIGRELIRKIPKITQACDPKTQRSVKTQTVAGRMETPVTRSMSESTDIRAPVTESREGVLRITTRITVLLMKMDATRKRM